MSSQAMFHVTVKAVIEYDGLYLILKKQKPSKDHFGYYEFPGGGMEYDESPVQAVRREVLEETGLEIEDIHPISTFHVKRRDHQIVGMYFSCKAKHCDVVLSDEHKAYMFVSKEILRELLDATVYKDAFGENE